MSLCSGNWVGEEMARRFGLPYWQFTLTATEAQDAPLATLGAVYSVSVWPSGKIRRTWLLRHSAAALPTSTPARHNTPALRWRSRRGRDKSTMV